MRLFGDIIKILSKSERKKAGLVLIFIIISAVIETVGVASIVPFLAVLADPSLIENNEYIARLAEVFNISSQQNVLFVLGCLVLGALIISNSTAALMNWTVSSFSHMRAHSLSCRVLGLYIHQPYEFFLQKASSDIAKNILSEVSQVVKNVIVTSMHMIARIIVSICIFVMLLFVDPILAISVMSVMGGAYILVFLLVKKRLSIIGELRMSTTAERYKILSEIFTGIKEIKISALEHTYEQKYVPPSFRAAKSYAQYDMIALLPRYIMETISFGGVLLIVLYLLANKGSLESSLPIIGLYAFAGQKLLPALQTIFINASKIKFGVPSLALLIEELRLEESKQPIGTSNVNFSSVIQLNNVGFIYKNANRKTIQNVNLTIYKGSNVGFIGGTGAGKSTLIDLISNVVTPSSGEVVVDGVHLNDLNRLSWSKKIGYVSQHVILFDESIAQNIALGCTENEIDYDLIKEVAQTAELDDFIMGELEGDYQSKVGENGVRLSGGQRQRIGIARALYKCPDLLILDEATSALDNMTEAKIIQALENKTDLTIIMIAHRLTTIKNCDVIYLLEDGNISAQGTFDELRKSSRKFQELSQLGTA